MRALPSGWRLAAVALAAASTLLSGRANADEGLRLKIDWGGLASLMRDGGAALLPLESPRVESRPESATTSADARWVGASPHLSVVARDWGGAQLLVGHLSLTDQSRVTRTSRMFITRVRIADGRLAPFAQVGLGQWRIDTDLMPSLPRDVELAAQLGGGFELALAKLAAVALEVDYTLLYRETHEPQMVFAPQVLSMFVAGHVRF